MPRVKTRGEREQVDDAPYKLAVNLFDLDRCDDTIRQLLLGGKLDLSKPVRVDDNHLDETGVVFVCDLLTAASCCDVLREHDRRAKVHPTRVYVKRQTWSRLPGDAILTEVVGKTVRINSQWFGRAVEDLPPEGLV